MVSMSGGWVGDWWVRGIGEPLMYRVGRLGWRDSVVPSIRVGDPRERVCVPNIIRPSCAPTEGCTRWIVKVEEPIVVTAGVAVVGDAPPSCSKPRDTVEVPPMMTLSPCGLRLSPTSPITDVTLFARVVVVPPTVMRCPGRRVCVPMAIPVLGAC